MPRKAKFSKDEIIEAALKIVRDNGPEALTARALGAELGSSARPVFTVFTNMEEVRRDVAAAAREVYYRYVNRGLEQIFPFKGVGDEYILFAMEEPKLFQLLFMAEQKEIPTLTGILPLIDGNYERISDSIRKDYGLEGENIEKLYRHLWIYTHGIAVLCATRMCRFEKKEIGNLMTEVCFSLIKSWKSEEENGSC